MRGSAAERYRQTREALGSMLRDNPHGIFVTTTLEIDSGELLAVTHRPATIEERADPRKSPMPAGVTSRRLMEKPHTEEVVIYIGPPAKDAMPPTGFHFDGINDHLFDDAMKQIHESSNQRQRHSP